MFHGLRVGPKLLNSVLEPIANSSRFNFPIIMASSSFNRLTTVASYGGIYPLSIFEAHVVFRPLVHMLSFMPIAIPASGPSFFSSSRTFLSTKRAFSNAPSPSIDIIALIFGLTLSIRSRIWKMYSSAVNSLFLIPVLTSFAERLYNLGKLLSYPRPFDKTVLIIFGTP